MVEKSIHGVRWEATFEALRKFEREDRPLKLAHFTCRQRRGRMPWHRPVIHHCVVGWLALDADIRALGLEHRHYDEAFPMYRGKLGHDAVMTWLRVNRLSKLGADMDRSFIPGGYNENPVTWRHVIERFEELHGRWLAEQGAKVAA